jgi:hypothetical protein|tara:strand:- start:1652 stop:1891 length:240 start_codon:yes stop_codon:yes gene_type:complete
MSIYVRMKDKFFSQWGKAEGKTSVFVVECDTQEQAAQVMRVASDQNEMTNIRQVVTKPKTTRSTHVSVKHYNNCRLYQL